MARPTFHSLTVSDVRKETADCVSIAFKIPDELTELYQFKAGQYLTLRADIDGQDTRRSYSICSSPSSGELRVAIKRVEGGLFSTWANQKISAGQSLQVMTPAGKFTTEIPAATSRKYLMIGAGSGVTPLISITRELLHSDQNAEVIMLLGNRFFNAIIFRDELEDMKDRFIGIFRLFHVLSGEPNDIALLAGRIDEAKWEAYANTMSDVSRIDEAFICGPVELTETSRSWLTAKGLGESQIHFELFTTPGQKENISIKKEVHASTESRCSVTMIMDGLESRFFMPMDGTTILDAAQNNKADIPFSCKGGMCCTCRAHISEGSANMKVNYALEPGEVEAGYVLTCQAVPNTAEITVYFDRH